MYLTCTDTDTDTQADSLPWFNKLYIPPLLRKKVDRLPRISADSLPLILVTFTNLDNSLGSNSNELAPSTKSALSQQLMMDNSL